MHIVILSDKKTHKISNKTHYTQSDRYPIHRHSRFCCATKHGFRSNARNQLEGDSKLDHMLDMTEDPVSPWGLMILSALQGPVSPNEGVGEELAPHEEASDQLV